MKSRKLSIFAGRQVPLVHENRPLLYHRYHDTCDVLVDARDGLDLELIALGLPQRFTLPTERRISDFVVHASPVNASGPNAETPIANEDSKEIVDQGNAEEAEHIRTIMGFKTKETDDHKDNSTPFIFDFKVKPHPDGSKKSKDDWSVFVGGMPYTWTKEEILEFWSECGEVLDVECMTFRDTGRFKGIAKVTYKTAEGYNAALHCNGDCWDGFTFVVTEWKHRNGSKQPQSTTENSTKQPQRSSDAPIGEKVDGFNVLFMCNLPLTMTEDEIATLFDGYHIEAVNLKRDSKTGQSKGYAHIHFNQADGQLEQAIAELDRTSVGGRIVRLGYAVPPPNWKPQRSKTKKERSCNAVPDMDEFSTPDGKYLVLLSGLRPSATENDVRALFPGVSIEDVVHLWSRRKQSNSGSVLLLVSGPAAVEKVVTRNDTFYQGRRLHIRPGKFSEYSQKKGCLGKRRKATIDSPAANQTIDDDPLMALL